MLKGKLWRDGEFLKLWGGQSISELGSQVSQLALPTVAILLLGATPFQVGLLTALECLAFAALGLGAGGYADRPRRRPIMIACDLARMVALASVPIAFAFNALTMLQLYVVALVTGVGTVFFDVSYQSYLPALISRADLVEGNSKLQFSGSLAQMAGPALAGFLIQVVGAARAVAVDAASFLVSVLSLWWIRRLEPAPKPVSESGRSGFRSEMWEGIRFVFSNPTIWKIAGSTSNVEPGLEHLLRGLPDLRLPSAPPEPGCRRPRLRRRRGGWPPWRFERLLDRAPDRAGADTSRDDHCLRTGRAARASGSARLRGPAPAGVVDDRELRQPGLQHQPGEPPAG